MTRRILIIFTAICTLLLTINPAFATRLKQELTVSYTALNKGHITDVAWSESGEDLFIASAIHVWKVGLDNPDELQAIYESDTWITSLAVTDDMIAVGKESGEVVVIDHSGNEIFAFNEHDRPVVSLFFQNDNTELGSLGGYYNNGKTLENFPELNFIVWNIIEDRETLKIGGMDLPSGSEVLHVGSENLFVVPLGREKEPWYEVDSIAFFDANTGENIPADSYFRQHRDTLIDTTSLTISKDGADWFFFNREPNIRRGEDHPRSSIVWNKRDDSLIEIDHVFHDADFNTDGTMLVTSNDQTYSEIERQALTLWDTKTWDVLADFGGELSVRQVNFQTNGDLLAVVNEDETISIWDTKTLERKTIIEGFNGRVSGLALTSTDEIVVASRTSNGFLWNLVASRLGETLPPVTAVAAHPTEPILAMGIEKGDTKHTVVLLDVNTYEVNEFVTVESRDGISDIVFSPDGQLLAIYDEFTRMFSFPDGTLLWDSEAKDQQDNGIIVFNQQDSQVLVGGNYVGIHHFDLMTGNLLGTPFSIGDLSLKLSPDGRFLASGGGAGTDGESGYIIIWDLQNPRPQRDDPAYGRTGGVFEKQMRSTWVSMHAVAFHPSGDFLVYASSLGELVILELENFEEILTYEHPSGYITAMEFHPDGESLVVGDSTGMVYIYEGFGG